MKAQINESKKDGTVPQVSSLSKKPQGRPLLIGQELDKSVQDYINAMREVGGVVNTAIVIAAANWIVAAQGFPQTQYIRVSHRHSISEGGS